MSKRALLLVLVAALVLGGAVFYFSRTSAPDWTKPETVAALPQEKLMAALREAPDALAKRRIVQRLGTGPEGLARLKAVWGEHADEDVRDEVILVTERLGTPDAARWLAELAGQDEALGGRAGAALGRLQGKDSAPVLAEVAASDAPTLPRANAVLALGASGSKEHAGLLAALLSDKAQPLRVRQEAALALGRVGGAEQVPAMASVLEELVAERTPDAEQLRISLIQGLGGIRAPEARAALEQHAGRELSPTERAFLSEALGQ
jgi:HEAT repeat protein